MEVLAIIPARGGSKGVERKNIRMMAGKPLLEYTVMAAQQSSKIKRIVLSTDDEEIRGLGISYGLSVPFMRPRELAGDDTPMISVIQYIVNSLDLLEGYKPDIIIILQPTSPLRTEDHIDEAVELFISKRNDSLVSVVEIPHNFSPYSAMEKKKDGTIKNFLYFDERKNLRQQKPVFYARNGAAIYIFSYDCLINKNSIYGDSIIPYYMSKEDSFDIDDEIDWFICEKLILRQ